MERLTSEDTGRINILIIGAGIAGLSLAALLKKNNIRATVIEKQSKQSFEDGGGYMLGVLPLGGRVINALDMHAPYRMNSRSMETYSVHDGTGKCIRTYSLKPLAEKYGPLQGISRLALIKILQDAMGDIPVHYETTVNNIEQKENRASVTFSDNSTGTYDLVVVADGIHSPTRKMIFNKDEYSYYQTGWGGWVVWTNCKAADTDHYDEYWGTGYFLGSYPVQGETGIVLGGPMDLQKKMGPKAFAQKVRKQMTYMAPWAEAALDAFENTNEPFYWDLHDCRTKHWHKGNIVLLGDAATGFLPTAGVGASMAMDSAAALADELSKANKETLQYALNMFVKRQKSKVEHAQTYSRNLSKVMFIKSALPSRLRHQLLKLYSPKMMIRDMSKLMEGN